MEEKIRRKKEEEKKKKSRFGNHVCNFCLEFMFGKILLEMFLVGIR